MFSCRIVYVRGTNGTRGRKRLIFSFGYSHFVPVSSTGFKSYIVRIIYIYLIWILQLQPVSFYVIILSILHQNMVYAVLADNNLDFVCLKL